AIVGKPYWPGGTILDPGHELFGRPILDAIIIGVVTGLVFLLLAPVGAAIFKAEALGFGDVKLATFMGLLLGWPYTFTAIFYGVIALALLWLIVVWIRWRSITYTLTDQRIAIETGVFGRQEKIIPIDRVQDCTTKQSIFGRILGYGRVEVDAAGSQGAEVLDHL